MAPLDRAQDTQRAAFVIDVARAMIVDANPAARNALGLRLGASLPIALDAAMPALRRLRALAGNLSDDGAIEALDFWSRNDPSAPALWRIEPTDTALVSVSRWTPTDETLAAGQPFVLEFDAMGDLSVDAERPPQRDDADTLKEIARQIRQGQIAAQTADDDQRQQFAATRVTFDAENPSAPAMAPAQPQPAADEVVQQSSATAATLAPDQMARLAHELKTPLTAIAAAAEIMRDERLGAMGNARYLDYARDVHESAAHALAVIQRLLTRGGNDAELEPNERIDLNDLVARTIATLQPLAAERRITLAVDADDSAPTVFANPTALRQILLNLTSNALKFTPAGGDVRAITGYLETGRVFLAVRDTGDGIDPALIARAKSGADASIASRPGGGYGIGLPLVCRLVAEMGADITFDSQRRRGSIALISF